MKFLVVLIALVAAVAAQLALPFTPYAGVSSVAAPFPYAAAPAMTYGAPFAYPGAAVAYTAPGPITYQTGAKVVAKYEPVEQHGYSIVY